MEIHPTYSLEITQMIRTESKVKIIDNGDLLSVITSGCHYCIPRIRV